MAWFRETEREKGSSTLDLLEFCIVPLCAANAARMASDFLHERDQPLGEQQRQRSFDVASMAHEEAHEEAQVRPLVSAWRAVLRALASQNDEAGLLETLGRMRIRGYSTSNVVVCEIVGGYYADCDDMAQAKAWYHECSQPTDRKQWIALETLRGRLLQMCLRKEDWSWGRELVGLILAGPPSKKGMVEVFVWAAGTGKGVDELERMILSLIHI